MSSTRVKRLRVIIYIRVSLEREKMYSPKTQLKGCLRHAAKYDYEVVGDPVEDLDKTGRDFATRKIAELILRIYNGEADGILIYRINRWGRNAEACLDYLKQLTAADGVLISTKEIIDLTTSAGRKAIRDAFSDAEYESDVIGDNWKAAHEDRWETGRRHSGRESFGYRRCPDCRRRKDNERAYEFCESCEGILVRDDRTSENPPDGPDYDPLTRMSRAAALLEFVTRLVEGEPTRSIVTDLAAKGARSIGGKTMDAQSWYRVADNGFWAGLIRRKSEKMREVTRNQHRPEDYDIWFEGEHDALLDDPDEVAKLWGRYKQVRASRKQSTSYNLAEHLGTGLLRCYEIREDTGKPCKASMTSYQLHSKRGTGTIVTLAYRCSAFARLGSSVCRGVSIEAAYAEQEFLIWLAKNAKGGDSIDEEIRAAAEKTQAKVDELEELKQKLKRQQQKKQKLMENYADPDSEMSQEDYMSTLRRFNGSIEQFTEKVERAQEAVLAGGRMPPEHFEGLLREWDRLSVALQRQALSRIIARVEVRRRGSDDRAGRGHGHNHMRIVAVWDAA
ncbi:recombinase family protein [Streptomyces sp. NPDC086776]|uniref:recombinase family protein n=1 Tax=Streptomyces sp. NPDC086776 TaxID=3365756 RepID=UPI0038001FEF